MTVKEEEEEKKEEVHHMPKVAHQDHATMFLLHK